MYFNSAIYCATQTIQSMKNYVFDENSDQILDKRQIRNPHLSGNANSNDFGNAGNIPNIDGNLEISENNIKYDINSLKELDQLTKFNDPFIAKLVVMNISMHILLFHTCFITLPAVLASPPASRLPIKPLDSFK